LLRNVDLFFKHEHHHNAVHTVSGARSRLVELFIGACRDEAQIAVNEEIELSSWDERTFRPPKTHQNRIWTRHTRDTTGNPVGFHDVVA